MPYRGHIKNGVVVLDEAVTLDEGAEVQVEVIPEAHPESDNGAVPLSQRLASVIGKVKGLPKDAAENHDHYLYGLPKE